MRYNEDNRSPEENRSSREMNRTAPEIKIISEERTVREVSNLASEDGPGEASQTIRKRNANVDREQLSKLAGTAVISVASLVVIASSGLINVQMDGSINEIKYVDNGIQYSITVKDVAPDNQLWFDVYQGSTVIATYAIENTNEETYSGDLEGYISIADLGIQEQVKNSDEGLSFDFHLCGDTGLIDRTYASWTLEVKKFESVFNTVTYMCDCTVSGYFLFTMDFVDDYGKFTDYKASVTDSRGTVRECTFSDNLHEQQKIFVRDLYGSDATFSLSFMSDSEPVVYTYQVII